jgi:hypothetical protein
MMTDTNREPKGETNISSDMVEHTVAKENLEIPDLDARLQQLAQEDSSVLQESQPSYRLLAHDPRLLGPFCHLRL